MKKTRKTISVVLVMLMLMSVMSFSSFAAFGFAQEPKAESVVFTDSQSVSFKELETYYTEWEKVISEYGNEYDILPSLMRFDLYYSALDYSVEVTMNDGSKVAVSTKDGYVELGKVYLLEVSSYITYDEYLEVSESGADTVDVVFEVNVYNNLFGNYTEEEPQVFTAEKNLTDCFVNSITEISGVPSEICENSDYYELDGAEFFVEYADGSTETYTLELVLDGFFPEYKLNGYNVSVHDYEGKLYLQYIDGYYEKEVTYVEEPFKSIEITDCVYDAENLILTSLSYKIEWKNGDTETYTYTPSQSEAVALYEVIGWVDGFNVYLDVLPFDINAESEEINYEKINITVSVGREISDTYAVDSPYAGALNAITTVTDFFSRIVSFFRNIISYIVNMLFKV